MISVAVSPTIIRLQGDTLRVLDLYAAAPEPGDSENGMTASAANLLWLSDTVADIQWIDPQRRLLDAQSQRFIQNQPRDQPGEYESRFPFKTTPRPFQLEVFAAARHMTEIAMTPVAMGVGKTKMTLDIAADKCLRGEIDTLCVIAPNGVQKQWVEQAIVEHMSDAIDTRAVVWQSTGKRALRRTRLISTPVVRTVGRPILRVLAFNVESFSSASGKAYKAAQTFLQSGKAMFVVDESSRIKSWKALRTKAIVALRELAVVRVTLSGTPITRGIEDLFAQYYFLDPAIIGIGNYFVFRNRYCTILPAFLGAAFGQVKIVGYRNVEEFVDKIASRTFVIGKDVLGLPEKTYERREVDLTVEQRRHYTMLRDELVADLRAHKIKTPANAMVRLLRLQQVLSGRYIEVAEGVHPDGEDYAITTQVSIPSRRLGVLFDVLNEHDGPAVIWCRFTADCREVEQFLTEEGFSVVSYFGETTPQARQEAVRRFREGDARYFVANPSTAGTGLDGLQVAGLAVYYSNSFAAEHRWQSEDRIHRMGMRGRAHYVDLVAPDTVDELVLKNLASKGDLARAVFEDPSTLEGIVREPDDEFG